MIQIRSTLSLQEMRDLEALLLKLQEILVWSYKDMLGVNPEISQHHILIYTDPQWTPYHLQGCYARDQPMGLANDALMAKSNYCFKEI